MGTSQEPIVTVLDTAQPTASPSDTGPAQTMNYIFLKDDVPLRLSISLGTDDSVVVEGKSEDADSFVTCHTWTSGDEVPIDLYVPRIWRARRSVDGTIGESVVKVENRFNLILNVDE